jgi:hypothetical protein
MDEPLHRRPSVAAFYFYDDEDYEGLFMKTLGLREKAMAG